MPQGMLKQVGFFCDGEPPGDKVTGDPPGIAALAALRKLSTESFPEHLVFHLCLCE